ncbi:MAG: histidine kinase [Gemmatimonadaceae bacterium]
MTQNDVATLVHVTGFTTGIVLYGMLAAMMLRLRIPKEVDTGFAAASGVAGSAWGDRIPLATALLGLVWNVGGLVIYGGRDIGAATPAPLFTAIAFAALGFLPAVVVHAASGDAAPWARLLTRSAYALSATGALLQLYSAAADGVAPSRVALILLSAGYGIIVAVLAIAMRSQPGGRRPLAVVALAAFAVMAIHLSSRESAHRSLAIELIGHHASLPLALVILYQDYRFAFADLFLKRALALIALVSATLAAYVLVIAPYILPRLTLDASDPRATALLLALWVAVAALYPAVRTALARFVDRVVLRRVNYARLRGDIAAHLTTLDTAEVVLSEACAMLAPALSARSVKWEVINVHSRTDRSEPIGVEFAGRDKPSATIRVPTSEPPTYRILIGPLAGGRRMLSDDSALADAVALATARRIDVLRVAHERRERTLRERDLQRLTSEAELRALRAQLNPHFLFNALTTIGYLVQTTPDRALDTLLKLTALLRAVLRKSSGEFVTIADEMEIVEAYLAIERARFEERLTVRIEVEGPLRSVRVPPLVLQPLVENAVKHGIALCKEGGEVLVSVRTRDGSGDTGRQLVLEVVNTRAEVSLASTARGMYSGIGLSNLERRLEHHYGAAASLSIQTVEGRGTRVEVVLPMNLPNSLTVSLPVAPESSKAQIDAEAWEPAEEVAS